MSCVWKRWKALRRLGADAVAARRAVRELDVRSRECDAFRGDLVQRRRGVGGGLARDGVRTHRRPHVILRPIKCALAGVLSVLSAMESKSTNGTMLMQELRSLGFKGLCVTKTADAEMAAGPFLEAGFDCVLPKNGDLAQQLSDAWHQLRCSPPAPSESTSED